MLSTIGAILNAFLFKNWNHKSWWNYSICSFELGVTEYSSLEFSSLKLEVLSSNINSQLQTRGHVGIVICIFLFLFLSCKGY